MTEECKIALQDAAIHLKERGPRQLVSFLDNLIEICLKLLGALGQEALVGVTNSADLAHHRVANMLGGEGNVLHDATHFGLEHLV